MNYNELKNEWNSVQNDFLRLTANVSNIWKKVVRDEKSEFAHVKENAGNKVKNYLGNLSKNVNYASEGISNTNRRPAWKTVAFVLGASFLVGTIVAAATSKTNSTNK